MSAQKKGGPRLTEVRNPKALRDYFVDERYEAGIRLRGTEVKSVRAGRAQIADAFARIEKGEAWLINAHIDPYDHGNLNNHEVRRARKLLMHRRDIDKIEKALATGGRAFVPLRMYFKEALVKVEMALCSGKKLFDKREDLKKKVQMREVERALRNVRR